MEEIQTWDVYLELLEKEKQAVFQQRKEKGKKKSQKEPLPRIPEEESDIQKDYLRVRPMLERILREGPLPDSLTLHQIRRMVKQEQDLQCARLVFETLDADEFFRTHLDSILEQDAASFQEYLLQNELRYHNLSGNPDSGIPLSSSNLEEFFDMFQGENLRLFIETVLLHSRRLPRHLYRSLFQYFPGLKDLTVSKVSADPELAEKMEQLLAKTEEYAAVYMQRMQERFPLQKILALLETRKRYRKLAGQYRRLISLRHAVLQAIPEHYRDLYPVARSIHRSFVLHIGPTNSGKTYDAISRLEEASSGVYLAPLRLLAYEQFDTMNHDGVPCNLLTGEEHISVVCANITASTIEMADLNRFYEVGVIDEGQMIADPERGGSWSAAILGLAAREIHVCASPDAEKLLVNIIQSCGDDVEVVHHQRQTPLIAEDKRFRFPADVRDGDALIVFSKRSVHAVAAELQKERGGMRASIIYGALPYDVRHEEARRFREGETSVVVATDAIGMGLNLPIQRVVFLEMSKFDGEFIRHLEDHEIKQIAGRAGRYGMYDTGYAATSEFPEEIEYALSTPDEELTEAIIQFPETLLGIDAPLTDILHKWMEVGDQAGWKQAKIERHLFLAGLVETRNTDKQFLYRMITIPFDESKKELLAMWLEMYRSESFHEHLDVLSFLPEKIQPENVTIQMLDQLEHAYSICDLCANYVRLFLSDREELRQEIDERKYLLSKGIMKILASRKLRGKTCKRCGRSIPWDYPYWICEKCYTGRRKYPERSFD